MLERSLFPDVGLRDPMRISYLGRAIAAAVASRGREDLISRVPSEFLDWLAGQMGGAAVDALSLFIGRVLLRLLEPVAVGRPSGISLTMWSSEDGPSTMRSVEDEGRGGAPISPRESFAAINDALSDPEGVIRRYSERQRRMVGEMQIYERAALLEGAADLFATPPRSGLRRIVDSRPGLVESWLDAILRAESPGILGQVRNFGLSLAGAYSVQDGDKAAAVFRHLRAHRSPINVTVGSERIRLYEHALFGAAASKPIERLRREFFAAALNDAALEAATVAAEVRGASGWLGRYVEELLASDAPALQARALSIAGLRQPNEQSDRILGEGWGDGFLGQVAAAARKSYRRAGWARHWLESAAGVGEPIDFWRFSKLAEGVADVRLMAVFRDLPPGELLTRFGGDLHARLKTAAENRSKKRAATLYGCKAPQEELAMSLRGG